MSYALLVLTTTLLAACGTKNRAVVTDNDPAAGLPEEGGFFPTDHEGIPEAVRLARASIFSVYIPSTERQVEVDSGLARPSLTAWAQQMGAGDPQVALIMVKQVEYCQKQIATLKLKDKKCQISQSIQRGTGFLLGDGKTLWTAYHLLAGARKYGSDYPVFIFNAAGDLVIDPNVKNLKVDHPEQIQRQSSLDYATISLPQEIGKPLKLAKNYPGPREAVFTVGFPSCTDCPQNTESRTTGPNANGKDMRVSRGQAYNEVALPMVNTSVDMVGGNSGGPGLNAEGEVFGIGVISAWWHYGTKRTRFGAFVAPPEWHR